MHQESTFNFARQASGWPESCRKVVGQRGIRDPSQTKLYQAKRNTESDLGDQKECEITLVLLKNSSKFSKRREKIKSGFGSIRRLSEADQLVASHGEFVGARQVGLPGASG